MTSAQIAHETRLERKRILRALTVVRSAMLESVPEGIHPARASHAHHAASHRHEGGARRGRPQPAVLGLRLADDQVWAEVVPDDESDSIVRSLRERKNGRGLREAAPEYAAVVYRGRLYRPAPSGDAHPPMPFGYLEGFWAYLHQRLRSKGGIRRTRLDLYLAEYAWRYNHRKLTPREQIQQLFTLIARQRPGVRITPIAQPHQHHDHQVIR